MLFEHIFNQVTHYNYGEKGWENLMLVSQMWEKNFSKITQFVNSNDVNCGIEN
jgi:hypothetical protein